MALCVIKDREFQQCHGQWRSAETPRNIQEQLGL